jgi:hypothetical protein
VPQEKEDDDEEEEEQQDQLNPLNLLPRCLKKKRVLYVFEHGLEKMRMVGCNHRQSISPILCVQNCILFLV